MLRVIYFSRSHISNSSFILHATCYICYLLLFSIGLNVKTDEEIDAFVREHGETAYHPSCTCKMGDVNDVMSVVDSNTVVKGIQNLRIVDASIMPSVVSGNLNGPVIMMAEKAADIIRGNPPLEKSNVPVYETSSSTQR